MYSIDSCLEVAIINTKRRLELEGVRVLKEFQHDMPEFLDKELLFAFASTLDVVNSEIILSRPYEVKYETSLDGDIQRATIMHNGVFIQGIAELQSDLKAISKGESDWNEKKVGYQWAAQQIREYGGRVCVENLTEGLYTVKTTIEIPVLEEPQPSAPDSSTT